MKLYKFQEGEIVLIKARHEHEHIHKAFIARYFPLYIGQIYTTAKLAKTEWIGLTSDKLKEATPNTPYIYFLPEDLIKL